MTNSFSVMQVAKAICEARDWKITHLELQKLLYISYMLYLGVEGKDLFQGEFQAWPLGPVSGETYFKMKEYGKGYIPETAFDGNDDSIPADSEEAKAIKGICDAFAKHTPAQLVNTTHRDGGAWQETVPGRAISKEDIAKEFEVLYKPKIEEKTNGR